MAQFSRHCLVLPFELPLKTKKKIVGLLTFSVKQICTNHNTTHFLNQICKIYISSENNFNVLSDGIKGLV